MIGNFSWWRAVKSKWSIALAAKIFFSIRKNDFPLLPCASDVMLLFRFLFIRANVKNKTGQLQCFLLK